MSIKDESLKGPHKDVYLDTLDRIEPEIAFIDAAAYYASAAISLKRIADNLEYIVIKLREEEKRK